MKVKVKPSMYKMLYGCMGHNSSQQKYFTKDTIFEVEKTQDSNLYRILSEIFKGETIHKSYFEEIISYSFLDDIERILEI